MNALGEFLRNRRGRIGPAEVGLPAGTGRRQTPGLRREELAALAGVSVDYYTRLEQGRDRNPGLGVLNALASALRLDNDERAHLHALARPPSATRPAEARPEATRLAEARPEAGRSAEARPEAGPESPAVTPRPGLLRLLEAVRPTPAYVLTQTSDILAANPEGEALLVGIAGWPGPGRNLVRYVFLHPDARTVFLSWQRMAEDCVAHLRTVQAEPALDALVGPLAAESPEFAELWAHYDVRVKSGARRAFQHPAVGRFELTSEILTAADGQRLAVFQADPGTSDADALTLLAMALQR